ncbi:ClpP/crotonase [Rhizodiscina lignyota]|uniref:ClpP/crotonase n=1 Tax=Rhizodiscina lignyota TaxID=1504668 RepID=A0A9P4I3H8_9PEZI|nr:ClpP/crotonase [Rhizodiscina lignyota]
MAPLSWTPSFSTRPPSTKYCLLSYPAPNILLVTLNRPKELNCMNSEGQHELEAVWRWLDEEPTLSVGIITGAGRAFSAGADLKERNKRFSNHDVKLPTPTWGSAGLSRRTGLKPVIAAVNGLAFGGGTEAITNCDMVIAASTASFCLPEVKRGLVPFGGAPPRLMRTVGRQRAMEMVLTGRVIPAPEAERWGLVNQIVEIKPEEKGKEGEKVVAAAVQMAQMIAENSPDAIIVARQGVAMGWESAGAEEGTRLWTERWSGWLHKGENMKEGVRAFVEKRKPRWKRPKL